MIQDEPMLDVIPCMGQTVVKMTRLMWGKCPMSGDNDLYLCRIAYLTSGMSCPEYGSIHRMMKAYKNIPISGENIVLDMKDHLEKAGCKLVWVKLTTIIHRGLHLSVESA